MIFLLALLACGAPEPAPAPAPPPPVAAPTAAPEPAPVKSVSQGPAQMALGASLAAVTPTVPTKLVTTPALLKGSPELDAVEAKLAGVVGEHGLTLENPWAAGHALLVFGKDAQSKAGEPLVAGLVSRWAHREMIGDTPILRFPAKDGSVRIEPHAALLLKAFTEAGVAPDFPAKVGVNDATLADLYHGTLAQTYMQGDTPSLGSWNNVPWALAGLAAWSPPGASWTGPDGNPVSLDLITHLTAEKLNAETEFLRVAIAKREVVEKRKQGIYAYTCGGAHLLQGVAYAVGRGFGGPGDRALVEAEVPVLFFRLDHELALIDALLAQNPEYGLLLNVQRLKFLGHFLESAHKLAAMGFYKPNAAQQASLKLAANELVKTVAALEALHAFEELPKLKLEQEQIYLDLIGDSAHAVHGLRLARGVDSVAL